MNISVAENIQLSVQAVWTHRFRSLLTILGVVIGITTVVSVASLLTGLRQGVIAFFEELGPDNVFVNQTARGPGGGGAPFASPKEAQRRPMDPDYAGFIKQSCYAVEDVGLTLALPPGKPVAARVPGYESNNIRVTGTSANMSRIAPREIADGRSFTPDEDRRGAHVAVIGASLAEALFPGGHAVGSRVMMDGAEYTVVGVYAKAKGGFFGEELMDNLFAMPLRAARDRYPQLTSFQITAKARPGRRQEAFEEIRAAMRRIRHVPTGEEDDFAITTPDQVMQQLDNITGLIGVAAIAISGLGLLVGGIGVMNIMLMSVTERTREIGVRKAIGARRRDIIGQFLIEAMTLTGLGGVLGIGIAVLITMLAGVLVPSLSSSVQPWALVAGFSVSIAVGLFFGVWPAVKAARLDPVEALRYE